MCSLQPAHFLACIQPTCIQTPTAPSAHCTINPTAPSVPLHHQPYCTISPLHHQPHCTISPTAPCPAPSARETDLEGSFHCKLTVHSEEPFYFLRRCLDEGRPLYVLLLPPTLSIRPSVRSRAPAPLLTKVSLRTRARTHSPLYVLVLAPTPLIHRAALSSHTPLVSTGYNPPLLPTIESHSDPIHPFCLVQVAPTVYSCSHTTRIHPTCMHPTMVILGTRAPPHPHALHHGHAPHHGRHPVKVVLRVQRVSCAGKNTMPGERGGLGGTRQAWSNKAVRATRRWEQGGGSVRQVRRNKAVGAGTGRNPTPSQRGHEEQGAGGYARAGEFQCPRDGLRPLQSPVLQVPRAGLRPFCVWVEARIAAAFRLGCGLWLRLG